MINPNATLSEPEARHLLRRTSLGGLAKDKDVQSFVGLTRSAAANKLLAFKPDKFTPRGNGISEVHNSWIKKMLKTRKQLQERLTLFWHDHFATSETVVQDSVQMAEQNRLLRLHCIGAFNKDGTRGSFKDFVKAINKDAAMMDMLDTKRNSKTIPNENYARELLELFTLGVFDSAGNPNYTQTDVAQVARAFTGWRVGEKNVAYINAGSGDTSGGTSCGTSRTGQHDYAACFPERGPKVIFQDTGGFGPGGAAFDANGEGAPEIDTVVDILFQHTDSDGQNTVARYVGRRLFEHFAYAAPALAVLDEVIAASQFDTTFSVEAFLRALFTHDEFYACLALPTGSTKKSVRWPVDFVVGTLRRLGVKPDNKYFYVAGGTYDSIGTHLENMGQSLLEPPSVFGWDLEAGWLSSATLLARFQFATDVASARWEGGKTRFLPEKFISLELTDPAQIVDAAIAAIDRTGQFTTDERQALIDYMGPGPVDLLNYDYRNVKLHGLFALLLQSPAYQVY